MVVPFLACLYLSKNKPPPQKKPDPKHRRLKLHYKCSRQDKIRVEPGSRATALQLHLPGIIPQTCHDDYRKQPCNALT